MTDDIIEAHKACLKRLAAAIEGCDDTELKAADAALCASFQRLNDRFSEAEECAFLRPQA